MTKEKRNPVYLSKANKIAKISFILIFFSVVYTNRLYAQADTVEVAGDIFPGQGNLNKIIKQVSDKGKLSSSVFKLELNSRYILTGSIIIPAGERLNIEAPKAGITQQTALPQILWKKVPPPVWPDYIMDTTRNYFFECSGNISLKNIWLCYMDAEGSQVSSALLIKDNNELTEQTGEFDGVIFDYCPVAPLGGGAITVTSKKFNGKFKNCYWRNCIDPHFRYYGRAVSFPYGSTGWHNNSLTFEQCTFANIGYVLMQEGGEYTDNVKFNHCTFLNVVMYSLESGFWYKMSVTNSIFVNTFMFGDIPAQTGEYDQNGGTIRIDSIKNFGFTVPFKEQERRILFANIGYYIEKWLSDWMSNSPYAQYLKKYNQLDQIPQPQPMLSKGTLRFFELMDANGNKEFPFMNKANLYDSYDPGFTLPPTNTDSIKGFLQRKWNDSSSENWAYLPELTLRYVWPLKDNLAYTNEVLLKAGIGSFPLGDLYRWFPEKYKQWKAQEDAENERITNWLETGKDKYTSIRGNNNYKILSGFSLSQNYPNPFNPRTNISYSVSQACRISIIIYDLLGRVVTTLINENKSPGNYSIDFDASNLSSGIYLYQIKASGFIQTKKMILLR